MERRPKYYQMWVPFQEAKQVSENAESINSLMLINQMIPQAKLEEVGKSGDSPNAIFSFRCVVDYQTFVGIGPNNSQLTEYMYFIIVI